MQSLEMSLKRAQNRDRVDAIIEKTRQRPPRLLMIAARDRIDKVVEIQLGAIADTGDGVGLRDLFV